MKKNLIKGFVGIMSVAILAACGADTAETSESSQASSATGDKIAQIQEAGVLHMVTSADWPPYEWHLIEGGTDTIVGFDVDIAEYIADELGVELKITDMDFDGLIPAVSTGKADIIMAGMNPTPERSESVDFSDIYIEETDVVLIKAEDAEKYSTLEGIEDMKWATQKATVQEDFIKETYPDNYLQSVGQWGTAILSLKTGKVDGILMVDAVAEQYVKQNPDLAIATAPIESTPNASAIAVQKGNEELVEKINEILTELEESGKKEEFYNKNTKLMEEKVSAE
ncbi:transporter substrate-binding domain-containing protein [Jeotgalibaca sp. A122]|uniref:transporter substrate-binding domain-containing protein n=1 Tax=Jeotgalibaca sp. A122 TaxID=3457322 RepID=UPI003FD28E7B